MQNIISDRKTDVRILKWLSTLITIALALSICISVETNALAKEHLKINMPEIRYEIKKNIQLVSGRLSGVQFTRDVKITYEIQLKNMVYKTVANEKEILAAQEAARKAAMKYYEGTQMAAVFKKEEADKKRYLKDKKTPEYSFVITGDAVITAHFDQASKERELLNNIAPVVMECPFYIGAGDAQGVLAIHQANRQKGSVGSSLKPNVHVSFEFTFDRKVDYSFQEKLTGAVYKYSGRKSEFLNQNQDSVKKPKFIKREGVLDLGKALKAFNGFGNFTDNSTILSINLKDQYAQFAQMKMTPFENSGVNQGKARMAARPKWPRPSGKKSKPAPKEPKDLVTIYAEKPQEKKKTKSKIKEEIEEEYDGDHGLEMVYRSLVSLINAMKQKYNSNIDQMNDAIREADGLTKWQLIAGKVISHLTGDLWDQQYEIKYSKKGKAVIFVNGIATTDKQSRKSKEKIKQEFNSLVARIENNTHFVGIGDLVQVVSNEMGIIDITAVRMAAALKQGIAEKGNVHVIAHSQGSMVFKQALKLLSAEQKKHIHYNGFGSQAYIDTKKEGLAVAVNYRNSKDGVPYIGNDLKKEIIVYANPLTILVKNNSKSALPGTKSGEWIYFNTNTISLNPSTNHSFEGVYFPYWRNEREKW